MRDRCSAAKHRNVCCAKWRMPRQRNPASAYTVCISLPLRRLLPPPGSWNNMLRRDCLRDSLLHAAGVTVSVTAVIGGAPEIVGYSRGVAIGRRSRSSICGSSRKIRGPRTRYRFASLLGFWTRRNSHSDPDFCIQSGARFSTPVMKSIEAPIHNARPRAPPRSLSFCAMISC